MSQTKKMAKVAAELYVADCEALPYEDDTFDRNQSLRNMPFRDKPDCRNPIRIDALEENDHSRDSPDHPGSEVQMLFLIGHAGHL